VIKQLDIKQLPSRYHLDGQCNVGRRHGVGPRLLVLLFSGPIGLILYMRGRGAVGAIMGGVLASLAIILAIGLVS
jgi:hypothetical protein